MPRGSRANKLYINNNTTLQVQVLARNQVSIKSFGSPGSVYDQYFDAYNSDCKPEEYPYQLHKNTNHSSISRVLDFDFAFSETEPEDYLIDIPSARMPPSRSKPVPVTSFDTDGENNAESSGMDSDSSVHSDSGGSSRQRRRTLAASDSKDKKSKKDDGSDGEEKKDEPAADEEEEDGDDDGEGIYDYYDILSVEKTDTPDKVLASYRKAVVMAGFERQTDGGKARIKEVSEAFLVLNDEKKKKLYDRTMDEENMDLVPQWKPKDMDTEAIFSDAFAKELIKELFKPTFHYTPLSYAAGAVIGFILLSWPGLVVFAYLAGRVGDWEDNRPPTPRQLITNLSDGQYTALMHALTRALES